MSGFRSIFRSPVPHIYNEQIKLTADMLNNLGTAFIIGGSITPFILQPAVTTVVFVSSILGLIFGVLLHGSALQVLKKLAPPENVARPTPHAS